MLNEYDVAVVGAGPAGSCAALSASRTGARTLLLEKKSPIGIPVRCGEFIPTSNSLKKLLPKASLVETVYALFPPETIAGHTDSIKFYSPTNLCFEFKFDGLVLKRELLEQTIVGKAEAHEADVYPKSVVKLITYEKGSAKILIDSPLGERIVKSKVVIGADGFPSQVASWAGMEKRCIKSNMSLTVQSTLADVDVNEREIEMYTGNKYAPLGYAWIIPKGEKVANVGLGVRMTYLRPSNKPIRTLLETFIKKHPVASKKLFKAKPSLTVGKMLPVGGIVKQIIKNSTLLVGDAAGLVMATNGSGIPTAMISGFIAGDVAGKFCRGNCELNTYESLLRKEVDSVLGLSVAYRALADKFMRSDRLFDGLLRVARIRRVSQVLKCERTTIGTFLQRILGL